jgi:predicted alpha/beta hydrolase
VTSDQPITFKRYSIGRGSDQSVGHFGYFRSKNTHIWQDILETINKVHHDKPLQTL